MRAKDRLWLFRSFWVLPPAACAALYFSWPAESAEAWSLIWKASAGLILWTLLEYVLHRFVFHHRARWRFVQSALDAMHLRHHRDPQNAAYIFVRLEWALAISAGIAALMTAATIEAFSTASLLCGLWLGFLTYEAVHYGIHCGNPQRPWIAGRRQAHFRHHFAQAEREFGVTTPIWDVVFRTR